MGEPIHHVNQTIQSQILNKKKSYNYKHNPVNNVFMPLYVKDWTTDEVVTKPERRPTIRALLYVVGSSCIVLFRESINVSLRKGPPTSPPTARFGLGAVEESHTKPLLQPVVALAGIEAPLWCTYCGYWSPYPTR